MKSLRTQRLYRHVPLLLAMLVFLLLALESGPAADAARQGLGLCARVILPSLFPFFVLSNLLTRMGLPRALQRLAATPMSRLFHISGAGSSALLVGFTAGYPLGAATVGDLYRRGEINRAEATRLLRFCNNSGPAFMVGAAGAALGSVGAGFLLYGVHILSALCIGLIPAGDRRQATEQPAKLQTAQAFSTAFPEAVRSAAESVIRVCGFVVFFTVVIGLLEALGIFRQLSAPLVLRAGLSPAQARTLLMGFLELGGGIGAMQGLTLTPTNLALAAFITSWGGLAVQFQTASVLAETELRHGVQVLTKLLQGFLAAVLAFGLAFLVC